MLRYKEVDLSMKIIPVDYDAQILPGTFEHVLGVLVDDELDVSAFAAALRNDEQGAPADHPGVLLKMVLLGYSKGLVSSLAIAQACRTNIVFMALSGYTQPHFTTIAAFVRSHGEAVAQVFTQVLAVCDRLGLIGRQMFAIDGVKLPANASKERSGRRADFQRELDKIEQVVRQMLSAYRAHDVDNGAPAPFYDTRRERKRAKLKGEAASWRAWLKAHPQDRPGYDSTGRRRRTRLSNRTDADSAKMATDKGVVQGYRGIAVVDTQDRVIVQAAAHGTGSEQELPCLTVQALRGQLAAHTAVVTDSGFRSGRNLQALEDAQVDAYIADRNYRRRDPAFRGQARHLSKPEALWDKSARPAPRRMFTPADFTLAPDHSHCLCPAGKRLYRSGTHCNINGRQAMKFKGTRRDSTGCPSRSQCLHHPDRTPIRAVAFLQGAHCDARPTPAERTKHKTDTVRSRALLGLRFATVEPVFGNLRHNKGVGRFTLRGQPKVDTQWKLGWCTTSSALPGRAMGDEVAMSIG